MPHATARANRQFTASNASDYDRGEHADLSRAIDMTTRRYRTSVGRAPPLFLRLLAYLSDSKVSQPATPGVNAAVAAS